jgi:hypothetical protein
MKRISHFSLQRFPERVYTPLYIHGVSLWMCTKALVLDDYHLLGNDTVWLL